MGFARVQFKIREDDPFEDLVQSWKQRLEILSEYTKIVQKALQELLKVLRRED
jgi:hypothetical protein